MRLFYHISKMMIFTTLPAIIGLPRWGQQEKMGNNLLGRTVAQSNGNSCLHGLQQMALWIYLLLRAQQERNQITGDLVSKTEVV